MPKPAFFVDGHMEAEIIRRIGCDATIRRLEANGKSVKPQFIASKISFLFKTLNNGHYPIYILIDREDRDVSAGEFASQIRNEMNILGLPEDQFRLTVCDRMIENWILADVETLKDRYPDLNYAKSEGCHGKGILARAFSDETPYRETVHGVDLFLRSIASQIEQKSPSFRIFRKHFQENCWWMNR